MVEVNGAEQEVEDSEPVEADRPQSEVEEVVYQLRKELEAAQADREKLAKALAAAEVDRAKIKDLNAAAKAALDVAEAAQKEAQTTKAQAATAATQAQKSATTAKQHEDSITATSATVQTTLGTVTANATAIDGQRTQAEEDAKATARLAKKAETVEATVKGYEDGFEARTGQVDDLAGRVESLLPGATSAGLAESFLKSRESKNRPRAFWLGLFLVSMGMLAWSLFWKLPWQPPAKEINSIDWMYLVGRLPLVVIFSTVAWVALVYFRTESRMQDDYRHKQDLAASYGGFRKLMSEEKPAGSPASYDLAQQTLAAIHAPPGRMYDKKGEAYTPAEGLINSVVERVTEVLKQEGGAA